MKKLEEFKKIAPVKMECLTQNTGKISAVGKSIGYTKSPTNIPAAPCDEVTYTQNVQEDMNKIPKLRPVAFNQKELDDNCTIGSMVEVDFKGTIRTGVIKWIGYVSDPSHLIAGLEMACNPIIFIFHLSKL